MLSKRLTALAVAALACFVGLPAHASPPVGSSLPSPVLQPLASASGHAMLPVRTVDAARDPVEAVDMLVTLAFSLRDVRYRYGGSTPGRGFDCSGFVRYVFDHALGVVLPHDSRGQYGTGERIAEAALQPGDLVFFRTHGRHVSHVGIYLDGGRFIHAPSRGETVRVDNLHERYWARRFVGARRPDAIATQ